MRRDSEERKLEVGAVTVAQQASRRLNEPSDVYGCYSAKSHSLASQVREHRVRRRSKRQKGPKCPNRSKTRKAAEVSEVIRRVKGGSKSIDQLTWIIDRKVGCEDGFLVAGAFLVVVGAILTESRAVLVECKKLK